MQRILNGTIDARPLAAGRITVGLGSVYLAWEWFQPLRAIARGDAFALPVASWLPDPSSALVHGMFLVALAGSAGMVLGLTRWPALAVAAMSAAALLLDAQTYSNHLLLLTLLSLFLGLSGSHRAWSVLQRGADEAVPYWPAFLIQAQVSTLYLWTGISKINDQYLSGEVIEANLRGWAVPPEAVLPAVAVLSIVTEIALSVILWIRPLFPLAALLGFGLHAGIVLALVNPQPLVPFAALMLAGYFLFAYEWMTGRGMLAISTSRHSVRSTHS